MTIGSKMKTILVILTLLLFSVPALEAEETIPGMVYRQDNPKPNQKVHVLDIDPSKLTIIAAHAKVGARSRESLEHIAQRYGAIAGINGGFFRRGVNIDGLPAGVLKIKDEWYGPAYRKRAAIGWSAQKVGALIDRIQTKTLVSFNTRNYPTHALNQRGLLQKAVLYTPAYGYYADSISGGTDIVIENGKIIAIKPANADKKTVIPKQGYVYAMGPKFKLATKGLKIGDKAEVHIHVYPKNKYEQDAWQEVENIIGGAPLLIYRGKKVQSYSEERVRSDFLTLPHARTAVGILKNGHWVFVVAENNIFNGTLGLTIPELATYMQKLGCEFALNLDGGGSSTLFLKDNVINHPQGDIDEGFGISTVRPISDAILVLPK